MKVIVSHDIDHIRAWEHRNMMIPKHMIRSSIELITLNISLKEYILRIKELFVNKWHNLEDIVEFNLRHQIPATFFMGMNNGLGLDYNISDAKKWVNFLSEKGFDVGVHGIAYQNIVIMQEEYNLMKNILNHQNFGIRMHYLRNDESTIGKLASCGYLFDTTLQEDVNPYQVSSMYEFPLHIMDVDVMYKGGSKWMNKSVEELKMITKERIDFLITKKLEYMTLLFHDRYFTDSFKAWKEWYTWSIAYLKEQDCEFISYTDAMKEIKK